MYAALCRALFGLNAMVAMQTLGRTRTIWWEHLIPRSTGSELSQALQWAGRLNCWLPVVASSQAGAAGSTPQAKAKSVASSQAGAAGSTPQAMAKVVAASKAKGQVVASSQERRYLYRAMTRDLSEFRERRLPTWHGEELAFEMLRAVDQGSKYESAWLHCSWNFAQARIWRERGRTERRHMDSVICRIDVPALEAWASSQGHLAGALNFERGLSVGQLIDMSHIRCMQHFERYDFSDRVYALFGALNRSKSSKEVLVCWRGHLPKSLFEVVDNLTGLYVSKLEDPDEVTLYCNVL